MKKLYFLILFLSFLAADASSLFDLIEEQKDEKFIEAVFQGADLKQRDKDGNTYLHKAILEQNKNIIVFLINHHNISINVLNHEGQSPLLMTILMNDLFSLGLLLDKGADIFSSFQGKSLISFISDPFIAIAIIKNYFSKQNKDYIKKLFFDQMLQEGNAYMIQAFLNEDQSLVNRLDKEKKTPLHHLHKIESLADRFETADVLIKNKAPLNAIDIYDKSPLFYNLGSEFLSKKLIAAGADIYHKDFNKESILFETVRVGNLNLLKYFSQKGMDLRQRNFKKESLLMHARDFRIIQFLLKKIKPDLVDSYGNNFLHHIFKDDRLDKNHKMQFFFFLKRHFKKDLFFQRNKQKMSPIDLIKSYDSSNLIGNQELKEFSLRRSLLNKIKGRR